LPGIIDSWISTPAALILVAQKIPSPVPMREPRLVVQIRSGGAIVCGNTPANARPVDPFDVRTFNTADLTGFLTNCHELKEGTYTICVQFFNIDKVAISQEVCKEFKVEDAAVEYSPPTLITPDNGKKFTAQELQSVAMFRWTPLVPKPTESVSYRLRVWKLMQGQNGTTTMRSNQPIVTKDVDNITQATVSGIYTGPCKPPYLCDFIWNVQALNRSGKPMGNNNGTSEPYTFGVADEKSKGPDNVFPEDRKSLSPDEAKREVMFRWTPIVPKPIEAVTYRLKVWQLMQGQNGSQAMRTNQPIVTKDVDNITEATVSGIYTGPCRPPYLCDYIWAVEASIRQAGATPKIIGTSTATAFGITDENSKGPDNVFPEDKKEFKPDEVKQTVTFRWTPLVPKPQEPVTYRLKVWQLMQGQNSSQAMRTNKPIVTKDVADITEATVSGIYTGPCRPPYLCDYIWNVQALSREGSVIGTSEPTVFKIAGNDIDIQIDSVHVSCCTPNGTQSVYIKIKNNLANTVKITQLNIDKVNGVSNVISIIGLAPALPINITGNGSQVFTGTIKCIDTAKIIRFFVRAEDALDNAITETEVEADTLGCPCDPCRYMSIKVEKDSLSLPKNGNPTQVNLVGSFSGLNPNLVKKITTEIIYFNITQTKDTNCAKCVFDSKNYGNFYPPGSALPGYTGPVFNKPDYTRLVTWNSTIIKDCGGLPHDDGGGGDNCGRKKRRPKPKN